jgi:aldose sugar dehydrogenase
MLKFISCIVMAFSFIFATCSNPRNSTANSSGTDSMLPPVETRSPNSDYKPAFPGQTRIGGVRTSMPYDFTVLTRDLNKPWGIATLPDGRLLITEKGGTMRIVTTSGTVSAAITGIPEVNSGGQGGLLGITIDPNFSTNRMVYWAFSQKTPEGNLTAVAKGRLATNEMTVENATVIYQALPAYRGSLHYGGRIVFDRSGNLFVSTGERSDIATRPQAQWLNSALGKVVHITTEGKPAPGNPFINNSNAKSELYSYGHRNVQGLAFHPETGELWENEFGPRGGDEINIIKPGKNYGWPTITYGIEYSGGIVGEGIQEKNGMEQPVYYWDPVLSPSGMTFYSGNEMSEWKNNLFVSGLNSNHIARLVIKNNRVVGEERLLAKEGQRFRDVQQGRDGGLYAITDEGRLYRIAKR